MIHDVYYNGIKTTFSLTQRVNSRVVHTDEMLFLAECIPISELGCEKIALYKTLMMY